MLDRRLPETIHTLINLKENETDLTLTVLFSSDTFE